MHIECEKGSAQNPRKDRSGAGRPSRRGSSPTDQRQAVGQEPGGGDISLEHVLVAAKRRRAPVTVETAGYVALAVADALVAAPASVLPKHVFIDADGNVVLRGARGRGDERAAEQSVRTLLATLLGVSVGSSPALAAAARRTNSLGVSGLITEVEAALIPVNRAAARRSIGRLAREVDRAQVQLPDRKADERRDAPSRAQRKVEQRPAPASRPIATQRVEPLPSRTPTRSPAPVASRPIAPRHVEPLPARAATPPPVPAAPLPPEAFFEEPVSEVRIDEATDIDARVSPIPSPAAETPWIEVESSAFQDVVLLAKDATPQLATYDPRAGSVPAPVVVLGDPHDLDEEEGATTASDVDELLTYEPPEALGDESLDFGTASPPDVGLAFPDEDASLSLDVAEALQAEVQSEVHGVDAQVEPQGSEPEACASGIAEPQASEPEACASEIAEPQASEPEACAWEIAEPEVLEPGACASEIAEPQASEPEACASGIAEPEVLEPEACASGIAEPEVLEPEACASEIAEPQASDPEACASEIAEPEALEPEPAPETVAEDAPDRVNELLEGFASTPGRSSRDVAGDLKNMLGLAPTPPPPMTTSADEPEAERAPDPSDDPPEGEPLPPIEYARPRNPKLTLMLTFALLVLAIAGMVTLYVLYPALLLGH